MQHTTSTRRAAPVALVLLLGAAFVGYARADSPDAPPNKDDQPLTRVKKEQSFCCDSVNSAGKGSGEGCVTVNEEDVDGCSDVLACAEGYTKSDGHVVCTE
jgi:hypothetical protein